MNLSSSGDGDQIVDSSWEEGYGFCSSQSSVTTGSGRAPDISLPVLFMEKVPLSFNDNVILMVDLYQCALRSNCDASPFITFWSFG